MSNSSDASETSKISLSYEDPIPLYPTLEDMYRKAYASLQEYGHQDSDEIRIYLLRVIYNQEGKMIIARDGEEIVGFAAVECNGNVGEIWEIVIHPDYQGQGMGQQLFDYACEVLRSKGCSTLSLAVGENNQRARRFYEKQGFHFAGTSSIWIDMEKDVSGRADKSQSSKDAYEE